MSSRRFLGRTLARSQALQLLFQAEATDRTVAEVLNGAYALSDEAPLDDFARELALGADAGRETYDIIISRSSTNWTIDRMPMVDRNLLRMALFEMLEEDDVAVAVTIDEVVELAKAYGTDESPRFVNGLLGRIAEDLEHGVIGPQGYQDEAEPNDEPLAEPQVVSQAGA
ncbi:MAG: transcription antitermination factor NusB [Atopobiaceae bacterium]|nr:transcription antitermination factor NusB [Atopobiaceae bacterium]